MENTFLVHNPCNWLHTQVKRHSSWLCSDRGGHSKRRKPAGESAKVLTEGRSSRHPSAHKSAGMVPKSSLKEGKNSLMVEKRTRTTNTTQTKQTTAHRSSLHHAEFTNEKHVAQVCVSKSPKRLQNGLYFMIAGDQRPNHSEAKPWSRCRSGVSQCSNAGCIHVKMEKRSYAACGGKDLSCEHNPCSKGDGCKCKTTLKCTSAQLCPWCKDITVISFLTDTNSTKGAALRKPPLPAGFRRLLWPPLPEHYQLLCLLTCMCNQLHGLCYKKGFFHGMICIATT